MEFQEFVIKENASLLEALKELNKVNHKTQCLLVVDENERMVGTLSDGDIRRGLITGSQLHDSINTVMHREFRFIEDTDYSLKKLKAFRDKRIYFIPILNYDHQIVDVINLLQYKSQLPIDAVLMAGGKGERLRPLTEKTPKPLLKVGDKAIIDHNVDRLIDYGVKHISVTVNYLGEQLEEHFKESHNGVQVKTVREPKFLGTIGSIRFVPEFFNDTVLVMNSDLFTNINYEDFYLHFKEHDADMSVAAVPYNVSIPLGIFTLDGRDIKGLVEKPRYEYFANAGIYLIKRSALTFVPEDVMFHSTDLIEALISAGKKVIRFPLNGTWIDIGSPQEYQRANDMVKYMH